ncbi:antitoxin AF2212-like protein [Candidatus Magnetobacterium casense]|uniref:DUF104 domain-containing protein n=1 Tax=Candidatus Magnetobacterium casense TaxID=1455061 RepID=A0ABS6RX29_9BACT|nr:antitoxin AF2212-like protein [Candidatus Magnetobacterium casensis]MBV6340584.1 DUF104 domain-containing protein [Candidatus Magnetobacterium casensis]
MATITFRAMVSHGTIEPIEKVELPEGMRLKVTIENDENDTLVTGKWAKIAQVMAEENLLEGQSEEFLQFTKTFRDDFIFKSSFSK